jgi:hypothetical protein
MGNAMKTIDLVREMRLSIRRNDWTRITKPLKDDAGSVNIHSPKVEEYSIKYQLDGTKRTVYDWWYSAILKDREENLYFMILAFHPRWSFYRIIRVDGNNSKENLWSTPRSLIAGHDFFGKIGYSERENAINIWAHEMTKPGSSTNRFARCTIGAGASQLTIETEEVVLNLTFTSLGLPFWINKGREAISSPRGDKMSGFYDICQVEGFILQNGAKTKIDGVGVNEHLMSFTAPSRFWKRVDGVFFCTDQIYCAFIYLESDVGTRKYEYKDGAVVLRTTREYLTPIDFRIEYLEFDDLEKVPTRIRISAQTTEGELNLVAEAVVLVVKQLALKIVEGQFVFKDGTVLRLTNGYGQHALH